MGGQTLTQRVGRCLLNSGGSMLLAEIATRTGVNKRQVAVILNQLLERDLIGGLPTSTHARRFVVIDRPGLLARIAPRNAPTFPPRIKYDFGPLLAAVPRP